MYEKKSKDLSRCTQKNSLAALDLFSQPVPSFNIRGRTKIPTLLGSILSGIVILVMLFYGANKYIQLLQRSNPTISSYIERNAITKYDEVNVRDVGLRFAFGFEGKLDQRLKDDPKYVKMLVRTVSRVDGVEHEKIFPYRKCQPSDYDDFSPPSETALYTLNKYKTDPNKNLFCLDWDELGEDVKIFGNWRDPSKYQRLEFMLTPCNYLHTKNGWEGDSIHESCIHDLKQQEDYLGNLMVVIFTSDAYFN